MNNNTFSAEKTTNSNGYRFQLFLLTVMCVMILIVSFIAFLKIEDNLQALVVLALGTFFDVFIFVNGVKQVKE